MKSLHGLLILLLIAFAHANETTSTTSTTTTAALPNKNYQLYQNENNVTVPHVIALNHTLSIGNVVHFAGHAKPKAYVINANFQKGVDGNQSIPIHLSTRFTEGFMFYKMVYNRLTNGTWEKNEIRKNTAFWTDREFDLRVRFINATHFTAYGNRKEIGVYEMRDNLSSIDHIAIRGDVYLKAFQISNGFDPSNVKEPQMFRANFTPGTILKISGKPTKDEFKLRLYRSTDLEQILFELKVNFNQNYIGRNAQINQMWSDEERTGDFPLKRNELVDIAIVNEKDSSSFKIYINDHEYAHYKKHFYDLPIVDTMHILGDFDLHSATVIPAIEKL